MTTAIRKALDAEARTRECKDAGTHPTRSGQYEDRTLGGEVVTMERCASCGLLIATDASTWRASTPMNEANEATCAACGDVVYVPADEDPADTLCVVCAEDEQSG